MSTSGERRARTVRGEQMPHLGNALSDVTQSVRELTESISNPSAQNLADCDRTALLALLEELEAFVRTTISLDQPRP